MIYFVIFLGGGIGSMARYALGRFVQGQTQLFPTGTLVVNVLGCIVIGLLAKYFLHAQTEQVMRAALIVGFCGGFTTFSSFSYETFGLVEGGRIGAATLYVVGSFVLCLLGTSAGYVFGPTQNP
jgi:fluoride exporter